MGKPLSTSGTRCSLRANCPVVAEQEMQVCHRDSLQSIVRAAAVLRPDSLQSQSKKHKTKHEMGMGKEMAQAATCCFPDLKGKL